MSRLIAPVLVCLLGSTATAAFTHSRPHSSNGLLSRGATQHERRQAGGGSVPRSLLRLHALEGVSELIATATVSASLLPAAIFTAPAIAPTEAAVSAPLILAEGSNFVTSFQENHTFLQGLLLTIAIKIAVGEVRRIVEKPVMDEVGRRVGAAAKEQLTPDTEQVKLTDWAKLAGCIGLDLAGDASELIPVLGELTDVAFAPAEAGLLQLLFKSPAISAFGFAEEILPFTDVVPTFTLSWVLSTLFPTTPLARALLPQDEKKTA